MRSGMLARAAVAAAAAPAAAGMLAACATAPFGTVCPAIGYPSSVVVQPQGAGRDEVAAIEMCGEQGCTPPRATLPAADPPLELATALPAVPDPDEAPTAAPPPELPFGAAERQVDGSWRIEWFELGDGPYTLRALAADGAVLAEVVVDELDWVRVGGTAECGGPMEAVVEPAVP